MRRSGFSRGRGGAERLWFQPEDVETMMEAELRKAGLYPAPAKPRVNVEKFIESHLGVKMDQHADLEADVLGLTEFYTDARPRIFINRDLTGAIDEDDTPPGILGRWRATMAHEASHVIMHRVLFEVDQDQQGLFRLDTASSGAGRLMRCMKKSVLFRGGPTSDWREVQANMGMAALLMPREVFAAATEEARLRLQVQRDKLVVGSIPAARLAGEMAEICEVSKQAAAIRMETLGIVTARGQGVLSQGGG